MTPQARMTLIRAGAGSAFFVLLIWLMIELESVTTMVMVAFFLAYILNPVVSRLESWGIGRPLASLLMLLLWFALIVGILLILIPAIAGEIAEFSRRIPRYLAVAQDLAAQLLQFAQTLNLDVPKDWGELNQMVLERARVVVPKVINSAANIFSRILASVFKSTLSIISTLVYVLLVPIIAYYLLASFNKIRDGITDLIPPYARKPVLEKLRQIDRVLAGFVRGQLTIALILACLYTLGFLLIGIDLAVVLGVSAGILFVVPYLGTMVGVIGGSAMALVQYGDAQHVAYVLGWIIAVQVGESYVLTPRIVGHAIGLHPVVYILALIIGANLFGFVGMLVAIPVAAVLKVLLVTAAEAYRNSYLYKDTPSEAAEK